MAESELLQWLASTLVRYGPVILFLSCALETAVFAGLILPVGALIALSAMLSSRGVFEPEVIVLVAATGALVGDQVGFAVGRWFRGIARPGRGEAARLWGIALARSELLVHSRGVLGISAARGVPFVRTVMPWFAGRSGIAWRRFFLYDVLGVIVWGTVYIGGGFAAGIGWDRLAAEFGEVGGALVALAVLLVLAIGIRGWVSRRVRRRVTFASAPGDNVAS